MIQSNIFNITKVKNGQDANEMRIDTGVETIFKFPRDLNDNGGIIYIMSPEVLSIGLSSLHEYNTPEMATSYTPQVLFNGTDLKELLGARVFQNYLTRKQTPQSEQSIYNYYFYVQNFYTNLYDGSLDETLSQSEIELLKSYFETDSSVNFEIQVAYQESILYKFIPLQIGTNLDIATFSIDAVRGILASMQDAGLKFDSTGLSILNGNFSITNSNNETVLNFDKNTGSLNITGIVNATDGVFHGRIEATDGYFNGSVNAKTGTIGGFDITEHTIQSQDLILGSSYENNESFITVKNINIGSGANIQDYLKIGNLTLINPGSSYCYDSTTVLSLTLPHDQVTTDTTPINNKNYYTKEGDIYTLFDGDSFEQGVTYYEDGIYFNLNTNGEIQGNNWSIKKENGENQVTARFGRIVAEDGEFNGIINARDGRFTGEVVSSIISASTINTVNFVTENTRSMGGSFIFKPTFEILDAEDKTNNIIEFTLPNTANDYFSIYDTIDLTNNFEQGGIENDTGTIIDSQNTIRSIDFIPVNENEVFEKVYTIADNEGETGALDRHYFIYYDVDKNFVSSENQDIVTIPQNIKFIKIVFGRGDWQSTSETDKITPDQVQICNLLRKTKKVVSISGKSTRFGELTEVTSTGDNIKVKIEFKPGDYSFINNSFEDYNSLSLFGSGYHDTLIGINSDDTSAGDILPPRALIMETFTTVKETDTGFGDIDYIPNLLLGDLSILEEINGSEFKSLKGYGLYADNVFLHGSLTTTSNSDNGYAGINTQKDIPFDYTAWGGTVSGQNYNDNRIIFWGGADGISESAIQQSPFIVTDKGNIFARSGEFKGTVISDSVITQSVIKTPIIYGTDNNPSLRIYDTNSAKAGIGFYKLVGEIDLASNENNDLLTLLISNTGFYHNYDNQISNFISFSESSPNIQFNGTEFIAGTTKFSNQEISDQTGDAKAYIDIIGKVNDVEGKIEMKYSNFGVLISSNSVRNFGGQVVNEGNMQLITGQKDLNYRMNKNGYYCLYVS